MTNQRSKCEAFVDLHQRGPVAYTLGRADHEVSLEEILQHCSALAAHTSIPINAGFKTGFALVLSASNSTRLEVVVYYFQANEASKSCLC